MSVLSGKHGTWSPMMTMMKMMMMMRMIMMMMMIMILKGDGDDNALWDRV